MKADQQMRIEISEKARNERGGEARVDACMEFTCRLSRSVGTAPRRGARKRRVGLDWRDKQREEDEW